MITHPDPEQIERIYLDQFATLAKARILEIGCGDGRLTRNYAAETRQTVGLDPDPDRLAQTVGIDATFLQARAEQLPFPAKTFDQVIMAWSL